MARDVVRYCKPMEGIWVDLGSGSGPLARALAGMTKSLLVLVDPKAEALSRATAKAAGAELQGRLLALVGTAEHMPLAEVSVDLVVSRGSIFFWQDRAVGLREVHRILRPGGKAMIGGGLGSTYPLWARGEFVRRRQESARQKGGDAWRSFQEVRSARTFRSWAQQADIPDFKVIGEGGLEADRPRAGLGIWLLFGKET